MFVLELWLCKHCKSLQGISSVNEKLNVNFCALNCQNSMQSRPPHGKCWIKQFTCRTNLISGGTSTATGYVVLMLFPAGVAGVLAVALVVISENVRAEDSVNVRLLGQENMVAEVVAAVDVVC